MILFCTALRQPDEIKTFSFRFEQLEFCLDFLNFVCSKGNAIISAHIIENGNALSLPPEAFTGQICSGSIKELEREWQALLS